MRHSRDARISVSVAAVVLGTRQAVLSDPRGPLPFLAHTWVRSSPGDGWRLRKQCALRTRTRPASAPSHSRFCHQAVFTLLLGPFTFFDVQKTKYLQILTSLMRWIGESDKRLEVCPAPLIPSLPDTAAWARSQG